jgi:hypothetical protein
LSAAVIALVLVLAACQKTGPPVIASVSGDTVVNALDSAVYDCNAWDWGNGPITYDWSCSRGNLAWDSAFRVKWYAPESSGPAAVKVAVTDLDNLTTRDSIAVRVARLKTTLVDYDGAVKAGEFREWRDSLRLGYELDGRFAVDTSRVAFFVLDDTNYLRWQNNQAYEPLVVRLRARADSFDTVVPSTRYYHFVLDNTAENLDKSLYLFIRKTTP